MTEAMIDIKKIFTENQQDAHDLYKAMTFGTPLPKKFEGCSPNVLLLKDMVSKMYARTSDMISIPFDIGDIDSIEDVTALSGKVLRAYASGDIGATVADQLFKFIRGHKEMIESTRIMGMLEELKKMESGKALAMKRMGEGNNMRFIPEIINTIQEVQEVHTEAVPGGLKKGA